MLHIGANRFLSRIVYLPLLSVGAALYAATVPPEVGAVYSFSMGGLLGETLLFIALQLFTGSAAAASQFIGLAAGMVCLALGLFIAGFTVRELYGIVVRVSAWIDAALVAIIRRMSAPRGDVAPAASPPMQAEPPLSTDAPRVTPVIRAGPAIEVPPTKVPSPMAPLLPPLAPEPEVGSLRARMPSFLKRNAPQPSQTGAQDAPPPPQPQAPVETGSTIRDIAARLNLPTRPEPIMVPRMDPPMQAPTPPAPKYDDRPTESAPAPMPIGAFATAPSIPQPTPKPPVQPAPPPYKAPPTGLLMDPATVERHVLKR